MWIQECSSSFLCTGKDVCAACSDDDNAICLNIMGLPKCQCKSGYNMTGDQCEGINLQL